MKKEDLIKLTVRELRNKGIKEGLQIPSGLLKKDIVDFLYKNLSRKKSSSTVSLKKKDLEKKKPKKLKKAEKGSSKSIESVQTESRRSDDSLKQFGLKVGKGMSFSEGCFEFPYHYDRDQITLLARDPEWLFSYWTVTPLTVEKLRRMRPEIDFSTVKLVLRLFEIWPDGKEYLIQEHYPVYGTSSYYLKVERSEPDYYCEMGFVTESGEYLLLGRSNGVKVPSNSFSPIVDHSWITPGNVKEVFNGENLPNSLGEAKLNELQSSFQETKSSNDLSSSDLGKVRSSGALSSDFVKEWVSSQVLSSGALSSESLSSESLQVLEKLIQGISSGALFSALLSSEEVQKGISSGELLPKSKIQTFAKQLSSAILSSGALSSESFFTKSELEILAKSISSGILSSGALSGALSSGALSSGEILIGSEVKELSTQLSSAILSSQVLSSAILSSSAIVSKKEIKEMAERLSSGILSSGILVEKGLSSGLLSSGILGKVLAEVTLSSGSLSSGSLGSGSLSSGSLSSGSLSSGSLSSGSLGSGSLSSGSLSSGSLSSGSLSSGSLSSGSLSSGSLSSGSLSSGSLSPGSLSPGSLSSGSLSPGSLSSGGMVASYSDRGMFFDLNTEVVVYGQTLPGAIVTVGGLQKKADGEGKFSLRIALPENMSQFNVSAVDPANPGIPVSIKPAIRKDN